MEKIITIIEKLIEERTKQIEEDAERRITAKVTQVLEHIAKTYDLNMKQLLADITTVNSESTICLGITAQKKRCCSKVYKDGYCKRHQKQKPVISAMVPKLESIHNHPADVLYVEGCPGCTGKNHKVMIEI